MENIMTVKQVLSASLYFFVTLVVIEAVAVIYFTKKSGQSKKETASNLSIIVIRKLLETVATGGILVGVLSFFKQFAFFELPFTMWMIAPTVIVADLTYYWKHRISHERRWFWSYHSVHHSSSEYNFSTAIRLPWLGNFSDSLFYIPAVLLGFHPILIAISKAIVLIYQFWVHNQSIGKLGWLDRVFNTPSNHRVHHGSNPQYLDKNHGAFLMVWDHLFGTYEPEVEPVKYGLTKPLETQNPVKINFIEPLNMVRDVWSAKNWSDAFQFVFGRTGWKPQNSAESEVPPSSQPVQQVIAS